MMDIHSEANILYLGEIYKFPEGFEVLFLPRWGHLYQFANGFQ